MSIETKWTQGEWGATDDGCGRWNVRVYECHEPHAVRIASVPHTHGANDNNEQSKANAHLIAAAPELYEALDELHRECIATCLFKGDPIDETNPLFVRVQAALAKALPSQDESS